MKKTIGNILLAIAAVGMILYLMANLTTTQQILVIAHFAFAGLLIYVAANGFGEVNKRLDRLVSQMQEDEKKRTEGE